MFSVISLILSPKVIKSRCFISFHIWLQCCFVLLAHTSAVLCWNGWRNPAHFEVSSEISCFHHCHFLQDLAQAPLVCLDQGRPALSPDLILRWLRCGEPRSHSAPEISIKQWTEGNRCVHLSQVTYLIQVTLWNMFRSPPTRNLLKCHKILNTIQSDVTIWNLCIQWVIFYPFLNLWYRKSASVVASASEREQSKVRRYVLCLTISDVRVCDSDRGGTWSSDCWSLTDPSPSPRLTTLPPASDTSCGKTLHKVSVIWTSQPSCNESYCLIIVSS